MVIIIKIKQRIRITFILLYLIISLVPNTQELNIGSKMPDISVEVLNYTSDKFIPSSLKGKTVILDFWSHICISCIKSFPRVDSFQRQYGDRVQVFLVNKESKEATDSFFRKYTRIKRPNVPMIEGDSILNSLFPHTGVPYYVWIDSSGFIRYTTDEYPPTGDNLAIFLKGVYSKGKNFKTVTPVASLFDSTLVDSFEYFSYLTPCMKGIRLNKKDTPGNTQVIVNCASIAELIQFTYEKYRLMDFANKPGRLILEVNDPNKYIRPSGQTQLGSEVAPNWSYSYHLQMPKSKDSGILRFMRDDLHRYFSIKSKIEVRNVKCLVLVRTSKQDKLKTKGGTPQRSFYKTDLKTTANDSVRVLVNQPFSYLSYYLNFLIEQEQNMPFVDKTGFNENIDLQIKGSVLDSMQLDQLRQELRKYDIDLVEKELPLEVLIIQQQ